MLNASRTRPSGLVLAAVALIAALALVSFGASADAARSDRAGTVAAKKKKKKKRIARASVQVPAAFEALRRETTEADTLPERVAATVDERFPFEVKSSDARRVGPEGSRFWMIPAGVNVCAVIFDPPGTGGGLGGSCGPFENAVKGEAYSWARFENSYFVSGLVPDGFTEYQLKTENGTVDVPTANNGLAIEIDSAPLEISWTTDSGERMTQELGAID